MQPKIKRVQGVSLMKLLTRGDIDVAVTFASEINDPGVDVVGPLPRAISTSDRARGLHLLARESARGRQGALELPLLIRGGGGLQGVQDAAGSLTGRDSFL